MRLQKLSKTIAIAAASVGAFLSGAYAESETKVEHDRARLSVFVQPSVSFLSFDQRKYFQSAIDTIYTSFMQDAVNASDSLNVGKQDFQKVNFCFPISGGIQYQFIQDNFISAGLGFIYDNESVVLTDRKNRTHNYSYTIQGIPLFLEYRFAIPKNIISLSGESLFSIALRWYWVLPGTEIYTTWGKLEAETPLLGAGYGVSLGYLIASWKDFKVFGDIGFSSIGVESKKSFADIVPDGPEKKAKWNVGGLQMQIRVSFGLISDPEPVEEDTVTEGTAAKEKTAEKNSAEKSGEEPSKDVKSEDVKPEEAQPAENQAEEKPVENATEKTAAESASAEKPAAETAAETAEKTESTPEK